MSILFLDNNYNKIKVHKSISVYILNKKKINFILFLKSLIDFFLNLFTLSLRYCYLTNLCKKIRPKIIIGDQFNFNVFKLKKKFPQIKIYMYISYLMSPELLKKYIQKLKKKEKIDYLFLPHKKLEFLLKKKIKAHYIYSGFLKNNEIKLKKNNKKKYDLMIISEYRNNIEQNKLKKISLAFQVLSKISQKYNYKICIAFVSKRSDKLKKVNYNEEKNFFDKFFFKYSIPQLDSYTLSNNSKIIFSMNSNLGYELLSRGQKVIFISNGQKFFLKNYPFICKIKDMEKKILKLINMRKFTFDKFFINQKSINFDPGNKILKNYLQKDLN